MWLAEGQKYGKIQVGNWKETQMKYVTKPDQWLRAIRKNTE